MAKVSNRVTLRDVYDAVGALEKKIIHRIETVETKVDQNTAFRNQLTGKIAVLFAIIGVGINWLWDIFTKQR